MANTQNLNPGGTLGNKGGGRPKSAIREACQKAFGERVKIAAEIADDVDAPRKERLAALDLLGKYGGLTQVDVTSDDDPIKSLTDAELWRIATNGAGGTGASADSENAE